MTVYCNRSLYPSRPARLSGVHLAYMPELPTKAFHIFSQTALAVADVVRKNPDVVLLFNVGHAPLVAALRRLGFPVVVNVDGLEWERAKWGPVVKAYYRHAAAWTARVATTLIADSHEIRRFYSARFGRDSVYVPYGVVRERPGPPSHLARFDLQPLDYALMIARLEPENNIRLAVEAFRLAQTPSELVVVGGVAYRSRYVRSIRDTLPPHVRFLGPIYEADTLSTLRRYCAAYIHAHEVGGTSPGLVQAFAAGCRVAVLDTCFNREVAGPRAAYFKKDPSDLARALMAAAHDRSPSSAELRKFRCRYNWDDVALRYEGLLCSAAENPLRLAA